ncbi:acetyl-CoA hydrolase/transferase family protein [Mycobacterium sp. M1]|uniref:Acetyl-CoA hydrolase/transferase family protein n=1 Tax=Mycolicibacter acidiphilus TaxID=2835306 RepID=A0ABS5RHR2_9MYCO|nr:acetyl-CoA hydrolase/transferase family protein [Mycolicibacter acidiphilus]MBS9533836.1 acetyl-CoA hydrolase/transferase family protein [Mycolicibacter acidiphilus]
MKAGSRITSTAFARKICSAEDAAAMISHGDNVGMSGFTGAGYPKAVPAALADRIGASAAAGDPMRIGVWTGASTAPELDGALAAVDGIELRLPYQSDPVSRARINDGRMEYIDVHLSHVAQMVWRGSLGHLDVAVVEVAGITPDGALIPSSSVGNNKTWLDLADRVILEVNSWQSASLEGMHDIYYGTALPPHRVPIPIVAPGDRIGVPYLHCPAEKVIAVVQTDTPDRNTGFKAPDATSQRIAGHILDFLTAEVAIGHLPPDLLPLQSGVGNVPNAVLAGLQAGPFENLTAYTEVIQDGMLDLIDSGKLAVVSATAFSLSSDAVERFNTNACDYRGKIVLRPQEISNHPEVVRRLGVIAMNGMIEADIYGNVNSTHVMGSQIMNGIGGSGDFARNGYVSIFITPSVAKGGAISAIVPMVSHVDHTEHDVDVIVTEQGLADLRGLSPKQRAQKIIDNCAHPDFRPQLQDYLDRAMSSSYGRHTPHLMDQALSWHAGYVGAGTMRGAGATAG